MSPESHLRTFRASNTASDSVNRIHDEQTARDYGVPAALVPASALLAHVFEFAADLTGTVAPVTADIRLMKPVSDGELLRLVVGPAPASVGWAIDLLTPDDTVAAATTLDLGDRTYRGSRPRLTVAGDAFERRPLTLAGLAQDERLNAMSVSSSSTEVEAFLAGVSLRSNRPYVSPAYLIAQFVPYLQHNFVRQQPSLYVGLQLALLRPVAPGTPLQLRGRIDRLFTRNARQYCVVETGWFDESDQAVAWALHTLIYSIGDKGVPG